MITLTDSALKQISHIQTTENRSQNEFLRIYVKKGGCSGFSYKLDFTEETTDKDKFFKQSNEMSLVIDDQSLLFIMGMTLDFEGGLNGQGFVFSNPNAKKTCSCGSSFAV